jgi:hypothetical protein
LEEQIREERLLIMDLSNLYSGNDYSSLANKLIDEYWYDFEQGKEWSYYFGLSRYVPTDKWASKEQWFRTALHSVENNLNVLEGLAILLDMEKETYLEKAINYVESNWNDKTQCLPDADKYYDLIAHFPEQHKIRSYYIDYADLESIDSNGELRKSLIRIHDEKLCQFISNRICREVEAYYADDEFVNILESYIMPRLIQMGTQSYSYIDQKVMGWLKAKCIEYLDKDRWIVENDKFEYYVNENRRAIWIRDSIAFLAWRLGWTDMIEKIVKEDWYWSCVFEPPFDQDNTNLLVWSLLTNSDILIKQAVTTMINHPYYKVDGAIAWKRIRATS